MAIRLKQSGIEDFVVLERAPDVGGAWHFNTYPGCRCDVPSHLYSFSFAPNPSWSNTYSAAAGDPRLPASLRRAVRGSLAHPHRASKCEAAAWIEDDQRWQIDTTAGSFTASVLVSGMGPLTEPEASGGARHRELPGQDDALRAMGPRLRAGGKRVASIGTGASAIQYVPLIQEQVEKLYVFQRTAPWIMPHGSRPISDRERSLFSRVPAVQKLIREGVYWSKEALVLGFVKQPRLMGALERLSRWHMRRQVADPGCRRSSRRTTRSAASGSCPPTSGIRRCSSRTWSS